MRARYENHFLSRVTLKGPKRSSVVVVLGGEPSSKNVPNGTKIVQGTKKCAKETKSQDEVYKDQRGAKCFSSVAQHGIELPFLALYSLM